jgi:hypothetical protein
MHAKALGQSWTRGVRKQSGCISSHKSTFPESIHRMPVSMQLIDQYRVGKPNAVIAFSQPRDYSH